MLAGLNSQVLGQLGYKYPHIEPLSGLAKKRRYWKTAVKGVIYNQSKHIRDLKISGGIAGGGGQRRGGIGGREAVNGWRIWGGGLYFIS